MKLNFRIGNSVQVLTEPGGRLGRGEGSAILLTDASVSSNHADVSWDGEQWWILPLSARNPVLRDGARLPDAKVPLGKRGKLQLGTVRLSFWIEGERPPEEAPAQPEWQRLRIKDVSPATLPPVAPPITDLSLNQAATLITGKASDFMPPTIMPSPRGGNQGFGPPVPQPAFQSTPGPRPIPAPQSPSAPPSLLPNPGRHTPIPFAPLVPSVTPPYAIAPLDAQLGSPAPRRLDDRLTQAGLLAGLLMLICSIGFFVGIWLEGAR